MTLELLDKGHHRGKLGVVNSTHTPLSNQLWIKSELVLVQPTVLCYFPVVGQGDSDRVNKVHIFIVLILGIQPDSEV